MARSKAHQQEGKEKNVRPHSIHNYTHTQLFIREINTDETERDFKNPIYAESSRLHQDEALPGQDNAQTQTGGNVHIYDVLSRGQPTGTIIDIESLQAGAYEGEGASVCISDVLGEVH